jgi:hypothetical protein
MWQLQQRLVISKIFKRDSYDLICLISPLDAAFRSLTIFKSSSNGSIWKMKDIKQENTDKTINLIYFLINIYMPSDLINTNDTMTIFLFYSKEDNCL